MQPLLQNKFVRIIGFVALGLIISFVLFIFIVASMNDARSTGLSMSNSVGMGGYAPTASMGREMEYRMTDSVQSAYPESSYYAPQPNPNTVDYTAGLESYEATSYQILGRVKQFDELCNTLNTLKADTQIHFKTIVSSPNNCNALFYVDESKATEVLNTLSAYRGVEVNRNTESVTKHRAQLQSQTTILEQQLASVERSLVAAETQFTEIAEFAKENKDSATLAKTIREKITLVESLTQQKINLTSRISQLYQQAADLEESLNVIAFSVNVNRSYPININEESQKWEQAWHKLKNEYNNTLIVLTATFGIFLLWIIRTIIYLLVLIIVLRGLWKFIKLVWSKW
jgi:hypothetical protein